MYSVSQCTGTHISILIPGIKIGCRILNFNGNICIRLYNIHASIKFRTGLLQDVAATLAATLYIRYLGPIERTE